MSTGTVHPGLRRVPVVQQQEPGAIRDPRVGRNVERFKERKPGGSPAMILTECSIWGWLRNAAVSPSGRRSGGGD